MILSQLMLKKSGSQQFLEPQGSVFDNTCSDFEIRDLKEKSRRESGLEQAFRQTFQASYKNLRPNQEIQGTFCIYRGFLGLISVKNSKCCLI